ncbi:hypothetical protein E4T52_04363 [Aureobasidium sp. EXF-3400]|nr:hypothetical protein E4T51_14430 [Aureobasidium sp. EXF-12344]KAI4780758.1 hypothetical protein E4T52_04363 [Aureobasidium sp. EXF-3400]
MVTLPGRASNEQTEQLRKSRAWLHDNIRNDWSYPNAPHVLPSYHDSSQAASGASASSFPSEAIQDASTPPIKPEVTGDARIQINEHIRQNITAPATQLVDKPPTGSRERYYSDGEDSASDNENDNATPTFDTPDSVGTELLDRKARRRKRRQQRFEDEMKENIGLAHWSAQRNTWTGAQPRTANPDSDATQPGPSQLQSPQHSLSTTATITPPAMTVAMPDTDLMIPVAPPLLPDNAVRSRITTNTYSDIYTKIVLQSRTPSIPINLTDITRSLVHGWKEEGQWPPKPTPAEPSLVKKHGHSNIKGGLNKLGRALGLRGQGLPIEKDDYVLQRPAYLRRLNRLAKAQAQARRSHPDVDPGIPKPRPKPKETADDAVAPVRALATPVPWQESMTKALKSGPGRVIDKCFKKEWKHSAERKLLWGCDNNDNDIDLVEYQKPIEESIRKVLPVTRIGEAF